MCTLKTETKEVKRFRFEGGERMLRLEEVMKRRQTAIKRIIEVMIEELGGIEKTEEKDEGTLTSAYAIGVLQEAIAQIESSTLKRSVAFAIYQDD